MIRCHKWSRLDMLAAVCLACEGVAAARAKEAELEQAGYSVTTGYCETCVTRFALDSLRGTRWAIPAGT